jgi:hypothetical protein
VYREVKPQAAPRDIFSSFSQSIFFSLPANIAANHLVILAPAAPMR